MKKSCLILLCLVLIVSFAACGASAEDETGAVIKNNRLVVTLESNPSTGYGWIYAAAGDECFNSEAEYEYLTEPHDLNLVGAPGMERFIFTPSADGETTLHFEYLRTFEENSTLRTFDVSVRIEGGKLKLLSQKYVEL